MMALRSLTVLTMWCLTQVGCAQVQKSSYPANAKKIDFVKVVFKGCSLGPCYSWWSIALRERDELLLQTGGHHPAGSRTRYIPIGNWKISGDTLDLSIRPECLDSSFMRTKYQIVKLYNCSILLPISETVNWDAFLVELQERFEESGHYQRAKSSETPETDLYSEFESFVNLGYGSKLKILVENIDPSIFLRKDLKMDKK